MLSEVGRTRVESCFYDSLMLWRGANHSTVTPRASVSSHTKLNVSSSHTIVLDLSEIIQRGSHWKTIKHYTSNYSGYPRNKAYDYWVPLCRFSVANTREGVLPHTAILHCKLKEGAERRGRARSWGRSAPTVTASLSLRTGRGSQPPGCQHPPQHRGCPFCSAWPWQPGPGRLTAPALRFPATALLPR